MHEMSVAQSMMELVFDNAALNNAKKITRVDLVVGNLSGVAPDSLAFCFDALKNGTIAGDAVLAIEEVSATAHCAECGGDFKVGAYEFNCPKCGGPIIPTGGKELSVRSIEIE
jgi:hydrogenase nickel incorporation protein HypA/HybF